MTQVRFGIIGIGNMGTTHFKYLLAGDVEGATVTAVCDIKRDRLEFCRNYCAENGYPEVACYENYIDMLESGKIDAVIIATPHYFHPIMGIEAFKRKVNVLCEKPIGVYTKKVEEFIDEANKSGCTFGIMFNQRTNPYYRKMREIVQSGELGELKRCVWIITDWYRSQFYYDSGSWRATWEGEGGGVLLNQSPHNLDLWQWIFGMPKRIRAFCSFGKYHNIEVEDDVTAYAEYENGATGVFITSTGECPGTNRLEISGSRGKLVYEKGKLTFTKLSVDEREYTFTTKEGFKKAPSEVIEYTFDGTGDQHIGITRNFTNHILKGEPLIANGAEGINMLNIANAMMLSTWTDGWVDLPCDKDAFYEQLQKRIAESTVKKTGADVVSDLGGTYGNN